MADIPGFPPLSEKNLLRIVEALIKRSEVREGQHEAGDRFISFDEIFTTLATVYGLPRDITAQDPWKRGVDQAAAGALAGELYIDTTDNALKMGV